MARRRIAIVGGGVAGVALAWCLTSRPELRHDWSVTLLHDTEEMGGRARSLRVWFDDDGRGHTTPPPPGVATVPIDIAAPLLCPARFPNLYRQVALPELRDHVRLTPRLSRPAGPESTVDRQLDRDLRDVRWRRIGGRRLWALSTAEYLELVGVAGDSRAARTLLTPYLWLLELSRVGEIGDAPLRSLSEVRRGWDSFTDGLTSWVGAMAGRAEAHGAWLRRNCAVKRVTPASSGVTVEWDTSAPGDNGWAQFDTVALTTEMPVNRELLDHPDNPHWSVQAPHLADDPAGPWTYAVHQDDSMLTDKLTYPIADIVGAPHPCHISIYRKGDEGPRPDPDTVIAHRQVNALPDADHHGLAAVQGKGQIHFVGRYTTMDSIEGDLISALVAANRIAGMPYPFPRSTPAHRLYLKYASQP